jgi:hypothetical protein
MRRKSKRRLEIPSNRYGNFPRSRDRASTRRSLATVTDAVIPVADEASQPVDWSELWEQGELVHHGTGSICPFLGPVQLRSLEADVSSRSAEKYLLARATPLEGELPRSLFILAVPKPKHVDHFVEASKGLLGGTPGRRLLGSIGLLHADRTRFGWRVDYVQHHYNNTSDFPLKRSVATRYAGWASRALHAVAEHVAAEGARVAFYGVNWVERERTVENANAERAPTERILVPQNALSLSAFTAAFRSRGYRVLHLGASRHFRLRNRSMLVALRTSGLGGAAGVLCVEGARHLQLWDEAGLPAGLTLVADAIVR